MAWDDIWSGIGDVLSQTGSDIVGGIGDFILNDSGGIDIGKVLPLILAGVGTDQGWFEADQPKIGYQGKIPRYQAVNRAVPQYYGHPDRMPGEYGQRYFTDTQFAPKGDADAIQAAADTVNQQANTLAQTNRDQSAKIEPLIDRMRQGYSQYRAPLFETQNFRNGGIADLGRFMQGPGDGMSDSIPAHIGGQQPAALGDGEFVVPADAVSHLGNGSSKAGADRLQQMIAQVRKARTGRKDQGQRINPNTFIPR